MKVVTGENEPRPRSNVGPIPDGPVPDGPVPDGPVPDGPVLYCGVSAKQKSTNCYSHITTAKSKIMLWWLMLWCM